jgi:phosphohistidine phosphatase SixA
MTMHRLRAAVTLASALVALCGAPARAQHAASAPSAERSSAPAAGARLEGGALVRALRRGGLVIYFRHTATDFSKNDRGMQAYDDCANQRPLNEQGRADAREIGQRIAALKLPIGVVMASPMCRTMEHARLMLGTATPTTTMRELTAPGEYLGLKQLLSQRVPPGTNRWMVGHGTPFRAVAGAPHLAEGEAIVLEPDGATWTVLARLAVSDWATLPAR